MKKALTEYELKEVKAFRSWLENGGDENAAAISGMDKLFAAAEERERTWIKTWSLIDPDKQYLVLAAAIASDGREYFSHPQLLDGWQVKRLMEGVYVAAEFALPTSIKEAS